VNFRGLLSNVRIRLDHPRAQRPSDRDLLLHLSTAIQNLLIEANLRGRYWAVDETELVVTPNTTEYLIGVEGFGKPLEVRSINSPNSPYIDYDVEFSELGDLGFGWDYPNNYGLSGGNGGALHNAHRIAFYHKQGNVYARVMPTPGQSARYRIIYQIGLFGSTIPLDEELLFPEHSALVELRTAISALPSSEWHDDRAVNSDKRKELALTLSKDEAKSDTLFRHYISSQTANLQPNYRLLDDIDG
jgi:hypothetical protein